MPGFPSSTHSSEPAAGRPRTALCGLALAAVLVAGAEWAARRALAPLGALADYWEPDAAQTFEGYARLGESGHVPAVVVAGDSTAARDLDPVVLARVLAPDGTGYSLAWPANFPRAMACTTLPLLCGSTPPPRHVVLSFSPRAFLDTPEVERLEAQILASPVCRRRAGGPPPSDWIALARLWRSLDLLRLGRRETVPSAAGATGGFRPLAGVSTAPRPPLGDPAGWERIPVLLSPQRVEALLVVTRSLTARGARVAVVVPPLLAREAELVATTRALVRALEAESARSGLVLLDYAAGPSPAETLFWDRFHLNAEGARQFSLQVAADLAAREPAGPGSPSEKADGLPISPTGS